MKGDLEVLLAPRALRFEAAEHPALHPGRCAAVWVDGQCIGHVGELHPKWRQAYDLPSAPVLFELDLAAVQDQPVPQAQAVPRQQSAWRDIALVAGDQVAHDALIASLGADEQGLVRSVTLFDIYKPKSPGADIGAGERSLALRLELLDDSNTLTDERIESAIQAAVSRAQAAHGVRLRG